MISGVTGSSTVKTGPVVETCPSGSVNVMASRPGGTAGTTTVCAVGVVLRMFPRVLPNVIASDGRKRTSLTETVCPAAARDRRHACGNAPRPPADEVVKQAKKNDALLLLSSVED